MLTWVYSVHFWAGSAFGLVFERGYAYAKARWKDRHEPLPDGQRHTVYGIDKVWLAGAALLLVLGYMLMSTQQAQEGIKRGRAETATIANEMIKCQAEFNQALNARAAAQEDYERLAGQSIDSEAIWLVNLAQPPPGLVSGTPEYRAWIQGTIRMHLSELNGIKELRLQAQQAKHDHPLPEPTCGK